METCPHCQQSEKQVKSGKTKAGSQRYKCQFCQRLYTPHPKIQGYPDEIRHQAIQLYLDGMNLRRIGRQLGIDHKTVSLWLKARAAQLRAPLVPEDVNNAELDELFTFVEKKKRPSIS